MNPIAPTYTPVYAREALMRGTFADRLQRHWRQLWAARSYMERVLISIQLRQLLRIAEFDQLERNEQFLAEMYNRVPGRWPLSRALGDAINTVASLREERYLLGMA